MGLLARGRFGMTAETFLNGKVTMLLGDVRAMLKTLPDDHFDCVCTSPPYWGLRNYGTGKWEGGDVDCQHDRVGTDRTPWANSVKGPGNPGKNGDTYANMTKFTGGHCSKCEAVYVDEQIGMESTLAEHISVMVDVFREVRRVLKPTGVCWINYGDCYATAPNGRSAADTKLKGDDDRTFRDKPFSTVGPIFVPDHESGDRRGRSGNKGSGGQAGNTGRIVANGKRITAGEDRDDVDVGGWGLRDDGLRWRGGGYLKAKDLCMVPERLFIALQDDGWWIRSKLPWIKRNGMPESVTDRPANSLEQVALLTKSERYWYDADAVRKAASASTNSRVAQNVASQTGSARANGGAKTNGNMKAVVRKPGVTPKSVGDETNIKAKDSWHESTTEVLNERNFRNTDLFFSSIEIPFGLISDGDGTPLAIDANPQGFSEAHFACVDDATEALTPRGWRLHAELSDGDEIAAYDRDKGIAFWQRATFHRYPFDGELVAIEKRDSSQRLTENHRCLVRRRVSGEGVVEAGKLKPGMQVPVSANLVVSESPGYGETFAALLGWYLTEGEKKRGQWIRIYQSLSANPKKVEAIRSLLRELGADFKESKRSREWRGRPSIEIVFSVRGDVAESLYMASPRKDASWSWLSWPISEIRAFVDAVIDGDGHRRSDGRCCVVQKDRGFLDIIQGMGMRLGWRGHIAPKKEGCFVLYLTDGRWLTLRSADGVHTPIGRERYSGTVWCPSVESTFWVARRAGKPFITGNTFPVALIEPLIKAGTSEAGNCPHCGSPWSRETEKTAMVIRKTARNEERGTRTGTSGTMVSPARSVTTGWTPSCDCPEHEPEPAKVLDPFGGSGTTALVAATLGRNSTIIELNPEYATLAKARIEAAFMGREEGSRHMVKQLGKDKAPFEPGSLFAPIDSEAAE
jgi:DNA modification methylase